MRKLVLLLGCGLVAAAATAATAAADPNPGFKTSHPDLIAPVRLGVTYDAIITVGETLDKKKGYMFEAIPDGISIARQSQNHVDIYVNHETSTVPFPFTPATGVGFNDFTNAMVSKLTLNRDTRGVLKGSYVIPSEANYQRFCSNFLASEEHGFERDLLLTNEEATDFVFRTGTAWPAPASEPPAEQAGVVVAYDVEAGTYRTIYGMGRHNHENSVAIPGYGHPVVLSGDDTFTAPSSQLYLYSADDADAVWNDEGSLWAFRSDNPLVNDYSDMNVLTSVSGEFIPVPRSIAVGPQAGLESWSNANNVFQFIRLEDIAYDRNTPNVVYLADTGEPRAAPGPGAARMTREGSTFRGPFPNGRLFRLELDADDPLSVDSFRILHDADAGGYNNAAAIHQLDNLETTARSVLIQEDPGGHNQNISYARIWRLDLATGVPEIIARVDQSLRPATAPGAWESSGIVDASSAFGPDAFLVDVQAGTLIVNEEVRGTLTYQREGGQLGLLTIPGA